MCIPPDKPYVPGSSCPYCGAEKDYVGNDSRVGGLTCLMCDRIVKLVLPIPALRGDVDLDAAPDLEDILERIEQCVRQA